MKWENKDSNLSAYDLQSLPAALAFFPCADDVGIEPCPEGPRQFSRLHAPMSGTIQAENCGPDPQTNKCSRSLAGWPYPGRLALLRATGGIRTCKISGLSGTRLPVTSQSHMYPRKDSNLQTLDPKSSAFTILTTRAENKKALDLSKAVYLLFKANSIKHNTAPPS
jgi:hypothetical protein